MINSIKKGELIFEYINTLVKYDLFTYFRFFVFIYFKISRLLVSSLLPHLQYNFLQTFGTPNVLKISSIVFAITLNDVEFTDLTTGYLEYSSTTTSRYFLGMTITIEICRRFGRPLFSSSRAWSCFETHSHFAFDLVSSLSGLIIVAKSLMNLLQQYAKPV